MKAQRQPHGGREATTHRCLVPVNVVDAVDDLLAVAPEPGQREMSQWAMERAMMGARPA